MHSIALIHSGKSFLPEIAAYQDYFHSIGLKATTLLHPSQSEMEPYDILWFFMGFQPLLNKINKKKIIVHEYCSASTPPLAKAKDFIKKIINPRPDLRISLTARHMGTVFSADGVSLITRRQGVHECFFERFSGAREFDFIYTGSALSVRETDKWLWAYTAKFPEARIILVGNHERRIVEQFRFHPNICFNAAVPITSLPPLLARARYAINYVPDVYPFNVQPSTKLLEYCAAGCHIISNRYEWVNQFCKNMKAAFFFTNEQFDNLSVQNLEAFNYTNPGMDLHRWRHVFEEMQIPAHLVKKTT